MDITELRVRQQMIAEWLDHDGTQFIMGKLHEAADEAALQYDAVAIQGDKDKMMRIAVTRWFIKEELPRMIEATINVPKNPNTPAKPWSFWDWFKQRCTNSKGE